MRIGLSLCIFLVILAGGCGTGRCSFSVKSLAVRTSVAEGGVAVVVLENTGSSPLLLARTHGVSAQGLQLVLETLDGRPVGYPKNMPEMTLAKPPATFCLEQGTIYEWRVPLRSFPIEYGGIASEDLYAFELPRGRYRVRAIYRDRCVDEPCDEVTSNWVQFSVE